MVNAGKQIKNSTYFSKYLSKTDFGMGTGLTFSSVQALANQYTAIGSYQVGYRTFVAFGVGAVTDNGRDDRRTATIKIYTAAGQLTAGSLRLAVADANSINTTPVQDDILSNWSAGVKVGEVSTIATFQSFLKILVNPTSTTTIDGTSSSAQCDVPASFYLQ